MDLTVLRGRRLLVPVTKARRHLAQRLAAAGASVEEAEFLVISATDDAQALENATLAWCAGDFDWLVVTSRNAVDAIAAVASARGLSLGAPQPQAQVAVVGDTTRAACEAAGLTVTLVPERRQNARGIVDVFPEGEGTVLAPLGNLAAPVLADGISAKGWQVSTVEAYRTTDGAGVGRATREELAAGGFDAVVLTSGSVARRFADAAPELPSHTQIIAIGESTESAARAAGLNVSAVAEAPSYDGIVASLIATLDPEAVPDIAEVYDDADPDDVDDAESADADPDDTESADAEPNDTSVDEEREDR